MIWLTSLLHRWGDFGLIEIFLMIEIYKNLSDLVTYFTLLNFISEQPQLRDCIISDRLDFVTKVEPLFEGKS